MDDSSSDPIIIRKLRQEDPVRISPGSSSFLELKTFLRRQAKNYQNSHIATTYLIGFSGSTADPDDDQISKVLGYVSITNSEIDFSDTYPLDDCPHANRYNGLPAVKIGRLLVDTEYQGQRLGSLLVNHIIAVVTDEIRSRVGCRFIIVDAKREAVTFYKKIGFTILDIESNHEKDEPVMFLDLFKLNGD